MTEPRTPTRRRLSLGVLLAVLLSAAGLTVLPAPTASAAVCGAMGDGVGQDEAIAWLDCQLFGQDGLFGQTLDFGGGPTFYPDQGLTLDAILALGLTGHGDAPSVDLALDAVEANLEPYITGYTGTATDRAAGATAKALLTGILVRDDSDYFDGLDLEADLRGLMTTSGPQAGRFHDVNSFGSDYSNGFSQALAIMALSWTEDGVPPAAVEFLLQQECGPGGGFRGTYAEDEDEDPIGCEGIEEGDTDYTAFAVQALLTSPQIPGARTAALGGLQWLRDNKVLETGCSSVGVENANSTGIVAQTFRAAGETGDAGTSAGCVLDLQLTAAAVAGTPAQSDPGTIVLNQATKTSTLASGIPAASRHLYWRSTAQAVLAFSAPAFGRVRVGQESPGDYDGDGISELAVFRPSTGAWLVHGSDPLVVGQAGDVPVPGDYDGDGWAEQAVWRPSTGAWILPSGTTVWGRSGDVPAPADYDGDGFTDLAIFRPSNGRWYVFGEESVAWGKAGDIPTPLDENADGDFEIAVYRPSNGTWYVLGGATFQWGNATDVPVPGDYDGDGDTDLAVYRPSNGTWYVLDVATTTWGAANDVPVPGDYDGNGTIDPAVFRPASNTWYVLDGATAVFGQAGDRPVLRPIKLNTP